MQRLDGINWLLGSLGFYSQTSSQITDFYVYIGVLKLRHNTEI